MDIVPAPMDVDEYHRLGHKFPFFCHDASVNCCLGLLLLNMIFSFFEFLPLNVSSSVLRRTLKSRRSIYVHHGRTQKLGGPEVLVTYCC